MIGSIVTAQEIIDAIYEMMPDDVRFDITPSGGGGFFVRINNNPENVLLRSADTFYQKLNDYCVRVEDFDKGPPRGFERYIYHPY
jgi:hypothetical protein